MRSEIIRMYKYPSMIKAMAFCAASFGFLSVVAKTGIVLIPEVTEVRICNILACCFGIWFGPAGAWGCALGNLIGDMGGSLTVLSFPGFLGNFLSAWLPYRLWMVLGSALGEKGYERPSLHTRCWLGRYLLGGVCSVVSCCAVLSFSFDLTASMPTANTFALIFLNNMGATLLGIPLFIVFSFLPAGVLPYWRTMMPEERKFSFSAGHRWKIDLILLLTTAIGAFNLFYLLNNGLGLRQMDEFGELLPMTVSVVYSFLLIVLTTLCSWREQENPGFAVSLD